MDSSSPSKIALEGVSSFARHKLFSIMEGLYLWGLFHWRLSLVAIGSGTGIRLRALLPKEIIGWIAGKQPPGGCDVEDFRGSDGERIFVSPQSRLMSIWRPRIALACM
ncbi:hypothetical protein GOBAR_AA06587 [Gossypium barbadense]|uniref:Uncharacterized protein n=1 Tax=Gossypium barbadense TaxID=3634 RepID=A0A2P5YEJ7_GOSBA|nr:hypothetical protein GOBAR_AA06587 [Gossypium barbadense]